MNNISRNPGDYSPTTHAGQQRKHRGIEWEWVGETIKNGGIKLGKSGTVIFVHNIEYEGNVRVVVSPDTMEVVTIMWETETAEDKHLSHNNQNA